VQKKLIFLFLIGLLALTPLAHATDGEGINLTDFPQALADYFGLSLFQAQILAALLMLSIVLLPFLVLTKGKNMIATLFVGMAVFSFDVSLGWFPVWGFGVLILITSVFFGEKILKRL
jgi:hypothetical protein